MTTGLLLAVTGEREAEFVQLADAPGTTVSVVRRCADVAELLAAARAGLGAVAVISIDVPDLDRTVLADLAEQGVVAVVIAPRDAASRAVALGAAVAVPVENGPEAWLIAAQSAAQRVRQQPAEVGDSRDAARSGAGRAVAAATGPGAGSLGAGSPGAGSAVDGSSVPSLSTTADRLPAGYASSDDPAPETGRIVAVWGPRGAPGRTTVALTLAAELQRLGEQCVLVDADTEAPSLAQSLALLDESSGIAAVCRLAAQGRLDEAALGMACQHLDDGLRVLTGLTRADRWRELPPSSLDVVWDLLRRTASWSVVDVSAGLDEGGVMDAGFGQRRHQAAASALAAADVVVVVGGAEPVAMTRLVRGLQELAESELLSDGVHPTVVVTRVRAGAAGSRPHEAVRESLARFAGIPDPILVPDDRDALDAAALTGRTLAETAPGSSAREPLLALAEQLSGRRRARGGRGRRRRAVRASVG